MHRMKATSLCMKKRERECALLNKSVLFKQQNSSNNLVKCEYQGELLKLTGNNLLGWCPFSSVLRRPQQDSIAKAIPNTIYSWDELLSTVFIALQKYDIVFRPRSTSEGGQLPREA